MEDESFNAVAMNGEINQYSSHVTRGLGFRAMLDGRMGYASTEAFDNAAVDWLITGARDSAALCEDPSETFIYDGREPFTELPLTGQDAPAEEKLAFALQMEREAKAYDGRIAQVGYNTVLSGHTSVRIVNTYGMDRQYEESACGAYLEPIAREGGSTSPGIDFQFARSFAQLNAPALARSAAKLAVEGLHASPVPSGNYRTVILNRALVDLLQTFSPAFLAEYAQKDLSLLKGKLGQKVAADCVTIADDPLRPDGLASRPFDAEGVPGKRHTVVDGGVFTTFLHNLKTAHKDGVPSTGNAGRSGYAGSVKVTPTNFYIEPGQKTFSALLADLNNGLVITRAGRPSRQRQRRNGRFFPLGARSIRLQAANGAARWSRLRWPAISLSF